MEIRILEESEILPALHLVWDVFVQEVAPCYTPEGIRGFQDFIQVDHIRQMNERGDLILFGAVDKGTVVGVLAFTPQGFIRLFYVDEARQGQGIGRQLFAGMYRYSVQVLHVEKITVQAAPGAVQKYEHLGFTALDQEREQDGRRFVPMEMEADPDRARHMKPKRKTSTIVLIVVAVVLLLMLLVGGSLFIRHAYQSVSQQNQEPGAGEEGDVGEAWSDDGSGTQQEEDELDALADLPAHVDSDLSYEIGEDTYTYNGEQTENTVIEFDVRYPTVKGLNGTLEETVNQAIADCALATVDLIYTNPSTEVKERVLQEEYPVLVSCLSYKVCYASDTFLSVAFTGFSYQGSWEAYHSELRTLNVDLTSGTVYEVPDIVRVDDDFLSAWLAAMRKEADNAGLLSEMSTQDMEKALSGDSLDGVYQVAFFADDVGVEIGFCFNYPADDENNQGYAWVTAPFTFDEIRPYATDSRFWQCLD